MDGNLPVLIAHIPSYQEMMICHWDATDNIPVSKVHGANMGPIWDRQDPCGPHVGPVNFAIWDTLADSYFLVSLISDWQFSTWY